MLGVCKVGVLHYVVQHRWAAHTHGASTVPAPATPPHEGSTTDPTAPNVPHQWTPVWIVADVRTAQESLPECSERDQALPSPQPLQKTGLQNIRSKSGQYKTCLPALIRSAVHWLPAQNLGLHCGRHFVATGGSLLRRPAAAKRQGISFEFVIICDAAPNQFRLTSVAFLCAVRDHVIRVALLHLGCRVHSV